MKNTNK